MIKSVAIATLLALGACSSGMELDDTAKSGTDGAAGTGADACTVTPVDVGRDELTDPNSPLTKHSIYFDFDSCSVKPEYQGLLDQRLRYLQSHNQRKVLTQSNTDERGTNEYNLSLGQERAEAMRRALSSMSVPGSQMEAVSLDKGKLQAIGYDEDSWAQNRRADTVYQSVRFEAERIGCEVVAGIPTSTIT